ncbi:MAG: hypothetical protein CL916_07395, partial [Deltaproteobacteria bacterium]|nr:hypothetical protein [Deltaproteobacteria bacterium]
MIRIRIRISYFKNSSVYVSNFSFFATKKTKNTHRYSFNLGEIRTIYTFFNLTLQMIKKSATYVDDFLHGGKMKKQSPNPNNAQENNAVEVSESEVQSQISNADRLDTIAEQLGFDALQDSNPASFVMDWLNQFSGILGFGGERNNIHQKGSQGNDNISAMGGAGSNRIRQNGRRGDDNLDAIGGKGIDRIIQRGGRGKDVLNAMGNQGNDKITQKGGRGRDELKAIGGQGRV